MVKDLLQQKAHDPLQAGAHQHAAYQQHGQVAPKGPQEEVHQHHAEAVNRAERPVQEAPVHQLAGGCSSIDDLKAPPQTGVDEEKHKVKFLDELSLLDKVTLISQLYAGQLMAQFMIKKDNQKITYLGQVTELFKGEIVIKTRDQFQSIAVEDILDIQLVEEGVENE